MRTEVKGDWASNLHKSLIAAADACIHAPQHLRYNPHRMSARPSVYLALAAGVVTIGSSAILVRLAHAPSTSIAFYRVAIAAALLTLPAARRPDVRRDWLAGQPIGLAFLGGLFFAADLGLWTTGIQLSGAATPTLMANTAPLWVGLGSYLWLGERRSSRFWVGLGLTLLGALVVLGQDFTRSTQVGLGTLLGLLGAFFYAGFYLITQVARRGLSALVYLWLSSASAAAILLTFNLIAGRALTGYDRQTVWALLAMGIVVQGGAWLLINYAQGYLPASVVAPTLLGQPVITAVLAALLLGEQLTRWHVVGGLTVLTGVWLVHRHSGAASSSTHAS